MNDKPLEDTQHGTSRITIFAFTIAALFGLTIFIMAGYGTWAMHDRKEMRQQIVNQTALAEMRGAVILKQIDEIQDLKFSQRWDTLLGLLLDRDREVEFDLIEDHFKQKTPEGMIKQFDPK